MVRKVLKDTHIGMNKEFVYRGEEQTRIETFSDAVFALAVTLLVLSSTVPNTFDDLLKSFQDIVPFAICITLLMVIWYQHYIFFIRYGFRDVKIVVLNTVLLFLVLTYVYPLKFLFKVLSQLFTVMFTRDEVLYKHLFEKVLHIEDASTLMFIYGIGAAAIFFVLSLFYKVALNRKQSLNLSRLEIFHTKSSLYNNILMGGVPLLSALVAILNIGGSQGSFTIAGFCYWSYIFIMPTYSIFRKNRKKKLFG